VQGVRTYFLYDGSHLVGEFDSSGVMQVGCCSANSHDTHFACTIEGDSANLKVGSRGFWNERMPIETILSA